jgi:hypothetical protein
MISNFGSRPDKHYLNLPQLSFGDIHLKMVGYRSDQACFLTHICVYVLGTQSGVVYLKPYVGVWCGCAEGPSHPDTWPTCWVSSIWQLHSPDYRLSAVTEALQPNNSARPWQYSRLPNVLPK